MFLFFVAAEDFLLLASLLREVLKYLKRKFTLLYVIIILSVYDCINYLRSSEMEKEESLHPYSHPMLLCWK